MILRRYNLYFNTSKVILYDRYLFPELYNLQVTYEVISSNLVSSAFTPHELEKVASTFDIQVGEVLLLETPRLSDGVVAGSHRTIFFSPEASKYILCRIYEHLPYFD